TLAIDPRRFRNLIPNLPMAGGAPRRPHRWLGSILPHWRCDDHRRKNRLSETATTREEISQRCAARIFCKKAPGPPSFPLSFPLPPLPQKESEGARDAGVAKDPRTLTPRGTKATRPRTGPARMTPGLTAPNELPTQVRRFPG